MFFQCPNLPSQHVHSPKQNVSLSEQPKVWTWTVHKLTIIRNSGDGCLIPLIWENLATGILSIQISHDSYLKAIPWHCTISSISTGWVPCHTLTLLTKIISQETAQATVCPIKFRPLPFQGRKTQCSPTSIAWLWAIIKRFCSSYESPRGLQLGGSYYKMVPYDRYKWIYGAPIHGPYKK